jgi:hypothetical protein
VFHGQGKRLSGSVSAVVGPGPGIHRLGPESGPTRLYRRLLAYTLIGIFSQTAGLHCWAKLLGQLVANFGVRPLSLPSGAGQCTDDAFFTFVGVRRSGYIRLSFCRTAHPFINFYTRYPNIFGGR